MTDAAKPPNGTPDVLHPDGWAAPAGFAHGIAATGRVIAIAGQVGWDPATTTFSTDDFAEQAAQALRNIVAVLHAGGAEPQHLVRLTWYVTNRSEYFSARKALGSAYRDIIGRQYPAMTVVVVQTLLEPRAKVEIEATAVVPAS